MNKKFSLNQTLQQRHFILQNLNRLLVLLNEFVGHNIVSAKISDVPFLFAVIVEYLLMALER
jgi:hypothetical protein